MDIIVQRIYSIQQSPYQGQPVDTIECLKLQTVNLASMFPGTVPT